MGGWALLVQSGLVLAGYSAVRPMASYRAIELQADNTAIGLLAASFSVLPLLLAYTVGRRADRFGPARLIVAGTVIFAVAGVLAALAGNLPVLLAASALLGLGHLVCIVGQQSAVAVGRTGDLDRGFGLLTSAGAVGQIVGPVLAGVGASAAGGWSPASVGLAIGTLLCVSSIACLPPLLRTVPRPDGRIRPPRSNRQVATGMFGIQGMTATLVAGGVALAALDLLYTFLPAWADERGVSVVAVGWLLAARGTVTLLVRLFVDRVVRRTGRRIAMMLALGCAGAGLVLLPVVGLWGALISMVLFGLGLGASQPLTMSWVADAARPGTQGAAMGLRLTANRLAQTALPVAVGVFSTGAAGVFWAVAALLALSTGVLTRLPPDRPPATGDHDVGG
ncbi:MFS transporter [Solwaraspora sp. WMMD1047]|uniref:MFS transporter n=1 Tax=Solwaraspora sp. WMMD1047 TaxID=3016102 RepID=UPI002416797D|nr:MFS transporter [Solwaraspora sp. WMMD1047]MDG4828744.1 MFS transporter [Solwaraspora sp. WMMD1047]